MGHTNSHTTFGWFPYRYIQNLHTGSSKKISQTESQVFFFSNISGTDTLVDRTSIVSMRYHFPAYEQRIRTDNGTFGQLFYCVYEEMADIAFLESLQTILTMAIDKLRKAGEFSEKIYRKLIDIVMGQTVKLWDWSQINAK